MTRSILIVGASMGGLRAAEQLRAVGWTESITVVGDEVHMPYNRPPLSKKALSMPLDATLQQWHGETAFRIKRSTADVQWVLGSPAVTADVTNRTVELADGHRLSYDGLVVATGLRPRRLPLAGAEDRRFVIRTIDDALALRQRLKAGLTVGVIGGGFIGCEVAVTLAGTGHHVVVIEPMTTIMERALGTDVGLAIQNYHSTHSGVAFHTGVALESIEETDDAVHLNLTDASIIEVDVLVESVGAMPNTEWLNGNGLDLTDGVLADNHLQVAGHPEIVAVGDAARFPNPRLGHQPRRIEHWCVPTDTAKQAARSLVDHLNGHEPSQDVFAPMLSFWSDQGDLRLQSFGSPALSERHDIAEGDPANPAAGLVIEYYTGARLTGVVLVNIPPTRHADFRHRVEHGYQPSTPTEGARP